MNPVVATADAIGEEFKPFKGAASYETLDSDLFFGRAREAEELTARILSSRLVVLHATSGAGKTSLLNARIIPSLLSAGWLPVRVRPGFNPVEEVKIQTLKSVIPYPRAEARAVKRAADDLATSDGDASLQAILSRYEEVPFSHDVRRRLLLPVDTGDTSLGIVAPLFCRVLQTQRPSEDECSEAVEQAGVQSDLPSEHVLDIEAYATLVNAVLRESPEPIAPITAAMPVGELIAVLESDLAERCYRAIIARTSIPAVSLVDFFRNLFDVFGARMERFSLALILDQFEELFTRFVDLGPASASAEKPVGGQNPDWQLRYRFFDALKELYQATMMSSEADVTAKEQRFFPIRYVISMREDYIAQLDPLWNFAGNQKDASYHLGLLDKRVARTVIQRPAADYGYTHSSDLFDQIVAELTREDRYVEPPHLQMVCDKLWEVSGRELSRRREEDPDGQLGEVTLDVLTNLKGTRGIFESVFTDFLAGLGSDRKRREALELLEPLITGSRTRNIVERTALLASKFKDITVREEVFEALERARIVRIEGRLGSYFAEITHEFLIPPVLEAVHRIASSDQQYFRLRYALGSLDRWAATGSIEGSGLPSELEFYTLDDAREDLIWPPWAIEAMLRSAIDVGAVPSVSYWSERFERECKLPSNAALIERIPILAERGGYLNGDELAQLTAGDRDGSLGTELPAEALDLVLASVLARSVDQEWVRHWTVRHQSVYT